jgi:hypothetical protein
MMTRTVTHLAALAATIALATLAAALSAFPANEASAATEPASSEADAPTLTMRGFLRDKDGDFTTIVPPGAVYTKAAGVNDRGDVVGIGYPNSFGNGGGFGFRRGKNGDYTTFVLPGTGPESRTVAAGINNRGVIAGWSDDGQTSVGYIRERNGEFTRIEHPDANGTSPAGSGTNVTGINNRGDVVGNYVAGGTVYGFLRDRRGNFTTIRPPGAAATYVNGVNDRRQIVGASSKLGPDELVGGTPSGFLLSKGVYVEIAVPGALIASFAGINNRGEIAGSYVDRDGTGHGFVRSTRGDYRSIESPEPAWRCCVPYDINERGQLTGVYMGPPGGTPAGRMGQHDADDAQRGRVRLRSMDLFRGLPVMGDGT